MIDVKDFLKGGYGFAVKIDGTLLPDSIRDTRKQAAKSFLGSMIGIAAVLTCDDEDCRCQEKLIAEMIEAGVARFKKFEIVEVRIEEIEHERAN